MPIVIFTISVVASFMIAWKAVEWFKPYHAGKAALFGMAIALVGPECIAFAVSLLRDATETGVSPDQKLNDALIKVAGGKMTCALLAVLAWCGGEAIAGTKKRRLNLAALPVALDQVEGTSQSRSRNAALAPWAAHRDTPAAGIGMPRWRR